jgi:hypothetical protein
MVLVLFCLENENNLLPVEFFWRTYVLVEMKKTGRCCWLALIFVNALVAMARNMQVALLSPVTEDEVPGGEDDITGREVVCDRLARRRGHGRVVCICPTS